MQKVQNMAAKLVLNRDKWSSNNESLKQLHWLPIQAWIDFKILVLTQQKPAWKSTRVFNK